MFSYGSDGFNLLSETTRNLSTSALSTTEHIYLPTASGPMPIATVIDGVHHAVHSDHLKTPRRLSDSAGQTQWQWPYSGFGEIGPQSTPASGQAPVSYSLRYPGQVDDGNGLFYNWHRFYDPRVGRYTKADPIGLEGGWNRFGYVDANPLGFVDPMGLATYICTRPLGGLPGSYAPPALNHTYVCVGSGADMTCGSTTASSGGAMSNTFGSSPGKPTTPATDYYKPEACEKRQDDDSCTETCIANELKKPTRPRYGVGPSGTDCQEYTEDVVSTCEKRCVRR